MSETPDAGAETAAATRGRPRPETTIQRDEKVLATLREKGALTRKELVEATELAGNEVYLSLYRLSRTTPPTVKRDGTKWSVVTEGATE